MLPPDVHPADRPRHRVTAEADDPFCDMFPALYLSAIPAGEPSTAAERVRAAEIVESRVSAGWTYFDACNEARALIAADRAHP